MGVVDTTAAGALLRRLLSGGRKPAVEENPGWRVAPAAKPTGGAKSDPNHPSRKHDLPDLVPTVVHVQGHHEQDPTSRRRDRRPVSRFVASQERKARRAAART